MVGTGWAPALRLAVIDSFGVSARAVTVVGAGICGAWKDLAGACPGVLFGVFHADHHPIERRGVGPRREGAASACGAGSMLVRVAHRRIEARFSSFV